MVKPTKSTTKPQISNFGRYRNFRGVISTPKPRTSGYVCIRINGKSHQLHRAVAVAFGLPRMDDQDTVDHIDNDPSNNRLDNLRWASRGEQIRHSYATNKKRASNAPKRSKPVLGRALGTQEWTQYPSTMEAARALGLDQGNISACCLGKRKRTGEYEFKWAEANEEAVLPGEVFKPYETAWVSNLGRYRNHLGVITTPKPRTSGYVCISINGKSHYIHRVMAVAFDLPKRDDQDTVDHIDNDPSNNRLDNLRWANRSEQIRHSYATNKKRASNAQRTSKPVLGRALGAQEWTQYPSVNEAARALGLDQGSISACCTGKQKRTGEYEFKWAEANEALTGEVWRDVVGGVVFK
jgi:plasmid maintenance system antidote protein VapI